MAAIGPKNTKPELVVRRLLHAAGLRFRLHRKDLPASLTSTCRSTVPLSRSTDASGTRMTATSSSSKVTMRSSGPISSAGNRQRDDRNEEAIAARGLRRLVVWQCAIDGKTRLAEEDLQRQITTWLTGSDQQGEITGLR